MSYTLDTLTTLKALTGTNKFNGLAFIIMSEKAWFVCDIGSTESADGVNIILPDDGIGRWYKCNNESNILNSSFDYTTTASPLTVDFTNYEQLQVIFTQNCTINFQTTLRNGYGYLVLNRNSGSWTITGWDARCRWSGASYNFTSGINRAILTLVFLNNLVYVTKISEYS